MTVHVEWAKGGTASFLTADDDLVSLRSTTPSPPGARLEGVLPDEPSAPVKVKIHGCKRESDGSFTLRGKLLEATRPLRDRVKSLVESPPKAV